MRLRLEKKQTKKSQGLRKESDPRILKLELENHVSTNKLLSLCWGFRDALLLPCDYTVTIMTDSVNP